MAPVARKDESEEIMGDRLPAVKAAVKTHRHRPPLFEIQDAPMGKPAWAKKLES
jgi:hypothetical protein